MIDVLTATDLLLQPDKASQLFRLRHRVFSEELRWCAASRVGEERDEYDAPECSPLYLLAHAGDDRLAGCLRLLPTTGRFMLQHTFGRHVSDVRVPVDDTVWEISRFAIDREVVSAGKPGLTGIVAGELIQGLTEFGLAMGIRKYVALYAASMTKLVARLGAEPRFMGPARYVGETLSSVVSFDVTEPALDLIRQATGRTDSVLSLSATHVHLYGEESRLPCLKAI